MKLDESIVKRKWEDDHSDRKSKRPYWQPRTACDVDVLQAIIRDSATRSTQTSQSIQTKRGLHASRYPVNCDPIDGVSPNHYMIQMKQTSCFRCLQGEAGHFRHIMEKQFA